MTIMENFRSSVRRGTGEAVLIMQQYPRIDFSKEIFRASTHVYGYDPQCEGSRGYYLSRLIDLSPQKDSLLNKILVALSRKKEDDYELWQMFNIARIYAEQGYVKARQAMYRVFRRNLGSETELIDLDGLQALPVIAHVKGKYLNPKKDEWEDDWLIRYVKEKMPGSNPMKLLRIKANDDPFIKKYIDSINENIALRRKSKKNTYNYKAVKILIDNKKRFGPYVGKSLKKRALSKLATDLLSETDNQKISLYLRVFHNVKFPLHYRHLLKFASSRYREVRECSLRALSLFSNNEIRKFALDNIKTSKTPEDYLPIFESNFKPADSKLILRIIKQVRKKDLFHWTGIRVLDIYENNVTKTCRQPLMEIYNRTFCNICREAAVRFMSGNGVLPRRLLKEIKFDSYVEKEPLLPA